MSSDTALDEALQSRLELLSRQFFSEPLEAKFAIRMELGGLAWRGYFPGRGELTKGRPDLKEGLYFGAELPDDHPRVAAGTPLHGRNFFPDLPGFRQAVLDYMSAMTRLGQPGTTTKPVLYLQSEFNETLGQFSPDGDWMAYASDESGKSEVYVGTIPRSVAKLISTAGGSQPRWRGDGKELFYIATDGTLMSAIVKAGPPFEVNLPTPLFKTRIVDLVTLWNDQMNYDVTRDGQQFLIATISEETTAVPTSIVLNWPATVRR